MTNILDINVRKKQVDTNLLLFLSRERDGIFLSNI